MRNISITLVSYVSFSAASSVAVTSSADRRIVERREAAPVIDEGLLATTGVHADLGAWKAPTDGNWRRLKAAIAATAMDLMVKISSSRVVT